MSEITLVAAFSTVPGGEAGAIKQLLTDTIQQIAQEDGTFTKAKIVFTESDERGGLTAELDGVKKAAGSPPSWTGSRRRACRFRLTSSSWRTPRPPPVPARS
jgi:hypothetical protein